MKFLSLEISLYFYKSTIKTCMDTVIMSGLVLLTIVWICSRSYRKGNMNSVGSSLAFCLESLAHRQNVASLGLFSGYYFRRCSSELAELVLIPHSWGRSTHYCKRLYDFSVTISRCYKDVNINSFFPCTVWLWYYLPAKYFLLTCDLNGFNCRVNRLFLSLCSFQAALLLVCHIFIFIFLVIPSMPSSGSSVLHGMNPSYKNKLQNYIFPDYF